MRHALHSLARSRGFTIAAVLTVALGITSTASLFTVVDGSLIKPLPYRDSGRLVAAGPVLAADFRDIQTQNQAFESTALYDSGQYVLSEDGEAIPLQGVAVSRDFFSILAVAPVLGRSFIASEYQPTDSNVVVLSHELWMQRFKSDPQVLGSSIFLNSKPYTIVGVFPSWVRFKENWFGKQADIWLPLALTPLQLEQRGPPKWTTKGPATDYYASAMLARLKHGVTIENAQDNLDAILARLASEHSEDAAVKRWKLFSLNFLQTGPIGNILWPLFGGAALLLLIACVNVSGLLFARGFGRRREMAIRSVLGARRTEIAGCFLGESLLVSVFGALLALPLSVGALGIFKGLSPPSYTQRFQYAAIDGWVLLFTLTVVLLSTVFCGLFSAIVCSRPNFNTDLKGSANLHVSFRSGHWLNWQKVLLAAQIGAATVLLIGAGLMGRSLWLTSHQKLGFNPRNAAVVSFMQINNLQNARSLDLSRVRTLEEELLRDVKALPMVQHASLSNLNFEGVPEIYFALNASASTGIRDRPLAYWWNVTPEFQETMGISLLRGRFFSSEDTLGSQPVVVINQRLASTYFNGSDPVGKHLTLFMYDPLPKRVDAQIVGVAMDTRMAGISVPVGPEIYTCLLQNTRSGGLIVRSDAAKAVLAPVLRERIQQTQRDWALVDVKPAEQAIAESSLALPEFLTSLVVVFAFLALGLTLVGIYGSAALHVRQRTPEIGIRMALGAQRRHILKTILFGSAFTSLAGVSVGLVAALDLTSLIRAWLYGVPPDDPLTFVLAGAVLLVVCLLASYIPSRRALRVDPAIALRHE